MRILFSLIALGFAIGVQSIKLAKWIDQPPPASLKKSLGLSKSVKPLLDSMGNSFYVLILPDDNAWKPHAALYKKLVDKPALAQQLILGAIVAVEKPVKTLGDLKGQTVDTVSGTPVIIDKSGKVFWGKLDLAGEAHKTGKALSIDSTPVAVLDDATIFIMRKFSLPAELKKSLDSEL